MADAVSIGQIVPTEDFDGLRSSRIPLIAYARDRDTLSKLRDALSTPLGPEAIFRAGGLAEAKDGLRQQDAPIAALIVDVAGEDNPIQALEELALFVEPGVRVFVVGDNETVDFYRQVTRDLGVQEYLYKPLNREIVARTFLPAILGRSASSGRSRGGSVVSVTGVRGGVGATTVAVNLSVQLAERSRHHTLLFDADMHGGTAALMLQGTPGSGLRTALENPGRVDALFAERSSPTVTDRLSLLAGEESLTAMITPPDGAAKHLTSLLCERHNFVVVDLPRFSSALTYELRDLAHVRIFVTDPTLAGLRDTLRFLTVPRGPHQAARPIVVLNKVGAPGSLLIKQVQDVLGDGIDVRIPWLPKQIPLAATLGKPAVRTRGAFQGAIIKLADEILPRRETAKTTRAGWSPLRLLGR